MTVNSEFRIVYQPKDPEQFEGKKRFAVGANSLHKYVGEHNAEIAIERALNSLDDKCTVRLRKHGRIEFYKK